MFWYQATKYTSHVFCSDILQYVAAQGDLAYPEKLEMMEVTHVWYQATKYTSLVFCSDILQYVAAQGDLAYPEKLEMMEVEHDLIPGYQIYKSCFLQETIKLLTHWQNALKDVLCSNICGICTLPAKGKGFSLWLAQMMKVRWGLTILIQKRNICLENSFIYCLYEH